MKKKVKVLIAGLVILLFLSMAGNVYLYFEAMLWLSFLQSDIWYTNKMTNNIGKLRRKNKKLVRISRECAQLLDACKNKGPSSKASPTRNER